jgi:FAD:protein FMN transferase
MPSAKSKAPKESIGLAFQAMSSECEIRLEPCFDLLETQNEAQLEAQLIAAAKLAILEVQRIEQKYSRYRADSIVSRINVAAGTGLALTVDAETAALLDFAQSLHSLSDGLFDITSGVLRRAWDFKNKIVPTQKTLDAVLPLISWSNVEWRESAIKLPLPGMELDFGGFGKEYAADRAMAVLTAAGQRHGFINLGGDIRVLGPRANGTPWRFGIQHPRTGIDNKNDSKTIAHVDLMAGALASSGDYERYFEHEGKRYCHILNPITGWPVEHWASVSVTAPACIAAGALSTIAMLKGKDATLFLETQAASYLAVDGQMRLFQSTLVDEHGFSTASA